MPDLGPQPEDFEQPRFRSGAAARMAGMPVATLRIWERRYRVVAPAAMPSGHRLYSAAQVERLTLLRQLSEAGHAIGTTAGLDTARLRQLKAVTPEADSAAPTADAAASASAARAWRVAVVGAPLSRRMQRAALRRRLAARFDIAVTFDTLGEVQPAAGDRAGKESERSPGDRSPGAGTGADLLLVHLPGMHLDAVARLEEARQSLGAARVAVLYRFASASVAQACTAADVALLREPQTDAALAAWLDARRQAGDAAAPPGAPSTAPAADPPTVPPRRYSDAALEALALLPSGVVCECPRHLAEVLQSLVQFEGYSGECRHETPEDAALHALLGQAAGRSRAIFEDALDRLVAHDRLKLPP